MPLNFLDDKGPGADAQGEPKDKKKEDHRQQILVIGSIVGVVIAWFTYKSVRGGASASGTTVSSASVPGTTTGTVAGAGMDTDAYNGFTSYLQNIQGQITDLSNTINTQANSTSTLPATTTTALSPIASGLFAPSGSTNWVQESNGFIDQIQSDGSLFAATSSQIPTGTTPVQLGYSVTSNRYSTATNVGATSGHA